MVVAELWDVAADVEDPEHKSCNVIAHWRRLRLIGTIIATKLLTKVCSGASHRRQMPVTKGVI
jgi:hypothetical protein